MNAALPNENKEKQLQTDLPSSTQNTIQVSIAQIATAVASTFK